MHPKQLRPGEIAAALGGVLLVIALFLPAYAPTKDPHASVNDVTYPHTASIWDVNTISRIPLLLAAVAPIVLVYIVIRQHQLSWPRGELTAVLGLVALTLVLYTGVIQRPGEPSGQVGLAYGWFLALLGALAIAGGGAVRASSSERPRKPPGVL